MAVPGISAIATAALEAARAGMTTPALPDTATAGAGAVAAPSFGTAIDDALSGLSTMHNTTDALAVQAATGDLADVHEYTIAATKAELATQLTTAVRDRAVNAFNEIMRMPI